ncbi:hypothetical protein I7I48_02515 [Histoplasma ohiense]|nr:hypothetical protein I7I48_02515 [Histoplasma ohiense (nom. inval.)]
MSALDCGAVRGFGMIISSSSHISKGYLGRGLHGSQTESSRAHLWQRTKQSYGGWTWTPLKVWGTEHTSTSSQYELPGSLLVMDDHLITRGEWRLLMLDTGDLEGKKATLIPRREHSPRSREDGFAIRPN